MINKPQNSLKSEELDYCIQLERMEIIAKKLVTESKIVRDESIKVLREFEEIDNYDCKKG